MDRCMKEEFDIFAVITRKIWFRHNTVVHGGEFNHPNQLITKMAISLKEFTNINALEVQPPIILGAIVPER
jgi:hypothetical protein